MLCMHPQGPHGGSTHAATDPLSSKVVTWILTGTLQAS